MNHTHTSNANCGIHIYRREYKGKGTYYVRGVIKDLKVGDTLTASQHPNIFLKCTEILSVNDSKGKYAHEDLGKNALVEALFYDESFNNTSYLNISNI